MEASAALELLKRGAAQIISEAELLQKLRLGRPLKIKLGVDPTSADLHLGHSLAFRKLRQFQDLGHQAVLIIGDFTSMIGDPSGRSVTRPQLSYEEVMANAETYRAQAFKILDAERTQTVFNGEWFRDMGFEDVIRLNSRVTLQQMLQREDFRERLDQQQPIRAHEIQYPIMQGWDSVMIQADVELGGTDQLFNILVGRDLQREEGQPQQVVLLVPILEGTDGVKKMSKSLGNYIGLNDAPAEMFGKLMSISDELMQRYYELLLNRSVDSRIHPMEAKKQLGLAVVETYHSREIAQRAADEWVQRFSERKIGQTDLPTYTAKGESQDLVSLVATVYADVFSVTKSRSDVRRLIEQGSVRIGSERLADPKAHVKLAPGEVLRLDKTRAVRIAE